MKQSSGRSKVIAAWLALGAGVMGGGCTGAAPRAAASAVTSTGGVALQLAPGLALDSLSYTIQGPGGFTTSGAVDVSRSTAVSALVGDLPAGTGFTLVLAGTAADGATTCSASATFAVAAHQTTAVSVGLTCKQAPTTGSVQVTGSVNVCPALAGVTASPQEVLVGGSIALSAAASDADDGPSPLSYQWAATSGSFDDATAAAPTFTCAQAGPATITVAVSDGDTSGGCAGPPFPITVTCTPAAADVQAVLDAHCTTCHGATNPSAGMSLVDVRAQIGVPSSQCAAKDRVTSGNSATSYLVDKIMGAAQDGGCFSGQRMPRGAPALATSDIQLIASWIDARTP